MWGVRAAGYVRTAGVSENRSQPCLNSCRFSHWSGALGSMWTHMTSRHIMQDWRAKLGCSWLTLLRKRRGYGRDISDLAPLFPLQTSHAKSCGLIGVGVLTPRQFVAFPSIKTKYRADRSWKNITKWLERRSVPRPLSGLLLSMENSSTSSNAACVTAYVTADCLNKG